MNKYPRTTIMPPAYDFKHPNIDKQSLHIWVVHPTGYHNDDPYYTSCMFCDGGLSACTVCGGMEGSLPTQCPGREMTEDESDRVYGQLLDFNQNRWWVPKPDEEASDGPGPEGGASR